MTILIVFLLNPKFGFTFVLSVKQDMTIFKCSYDIFGIEMSKKFNATANSDG